jgi:hypothetical protein
MSRLASKDYEVVGFTYSGSFPLDFLRSDERMEATGNGAGHIVITSPRGSLRVKPGALITRRPDGSLFSTSSPPSQDFGPEHQRDGSPWGDRAVASPPATPNSGTGDGSGVAGSNLDLATGQGRR